MKKLLILLPLFVLIVAGVSVVHAQTPIASPSDTNTATVISDYAKDVQSGEKGTVNDVQAQNNQKNIADNENIQAKEETETVETVEKIEPKEAVEPQEAVENENGGSGGSEGSGIKSEGQQPGANNINGTSEGGSKSEGN